jgi:4-hydroxybenzoate polyprenyltransferase
MRDAPFPPPGRVMSSPRARIDAYLRLVRLDKPIGTLLLLWPTLSALWFAAEGVPPGSLIAIFVVGTLLTRSAGCAFNDWADREFDAGVKRTASRPLAAKIIAPGEALMVAVVLALVAFVLILPTNRATIAWSFPAVAIAIAYPFFKRFFALPQAFLGIAFSFGIPMAFAAVQNGVPLFAWTLLLINLFWVVAYDTEYAMVDRDDDIKIGIRTSALTLGRFDVAAVAACYAIYIGAMTIVGVRTAMGTFYYTGLAVAFAFAVQHLWWIRTREREQCFRAFLDNHWLGLAVFAGVALDYAIRLHRWPRVW